MQAQIRAARVLSRAQFSWRLRHHLVGSVASPCYAVRCVATSTSSPPIRTTTTTSVSASPSTPSSPLPVHADLMKELKLILARSPEDKWIPIADLYAEIPSAMRRQHVRPHRTLLAVLEQVATLLCIHLDAEGVKYATGATAPPPIEVDSSSSPPAKKPTPAPVVVPLHGGFSTLVRNAAVANDGTQPVDFYYDVNLSEFPPPPPDFDVTPSALPLPQASKDGAVMALADFVAFIPPFFVPLSAVLEKMPGYTEAHMESYFSSKAIEMVTVADTRFIRLYGGYGKIKLTGCEVAEESFAEYKPKPQLAEHFVKAFGGVTNQWMPLQVLLQRSDPVAVSRLLPLEGPTTVIYFAQMQHIFSFAVSKHGSGGTSVLLRPPNYGGLEAETTPTPKVLNYLLHCIPTEGNVDIQETVLSGMPAHIHDELVAYYGDIHGFFNAHAPVFHEAEDRIVVMRTSYRRRLHVASLPLEEQLQLAVERRDKHRIRTLRRRIAFRDDPSNPLHDPDNLAREVAKHVPSRGFVTMKTFLKKHVPEEMLFYMPKKMHNFFVAYPQYFQHFEFQQAGNFCISRPGQPLPRGVIRQQFTEEDLLRLTAEYLQQRGGGRPCTTVFLNLPRGAQDVIRKKHGGLYYFVEKYPQFFNVVLGSDTENAKSSAVVHLVQMPTAQSMAYDREKEKRNSSFDGDDDDDDNVHMSEEED